MTDKCYRCGGPVPIPNIEEAINRELNFRDQFPDTDGEERVLICIPCADILAELHEQED